MNAVCTYRLQHEGFSCQVWCLASSVWVHSWSYAERSDGRLGPLVTAVLYTCINNEYFFFLFSRRHKEELLCLEFKHYRWERGYTSQPGNSSIPSAIYGTDTGPHLSSWISSRSFLFNCFVEIRLEKHSNAWRASQNLLRRRLTNLNPDWSASNHIIGKFMLIWVCLL